MTSQSAATQSPSEQGAPSQELQAERRAGAGAGAQRRGSAPAPARGPLPPGRAPWSPTTAHGRSSLRSPCWSRTWTRRRPSRYRQGGAAGLDEGLGTWPRDPNPCLAPALQRTSSGTHSPSLWGSPYPPPTAEPRLVTSTGPCAGCLLQRRSLPAQPWGHDPSSATSDITSPQTQSTPRVSQLGIAKLKGTAGRVRRAGGGEWVEKTALLPSSHPHLGFECGTQRDEDSYKGALGRGWGVLQADVPFCKSEHVGPGYNSALWSRESG